MKNSRSYSTFSTVCSDHRVISATLKRSLTASQQAVSHPMKSIDWKEVASNSQMCKGFTTQVFNKFQLVSTTGVDTENFEDVYSKLIKSREEVALATLPKKKRRSELKPTASQRVVDARIKLKSISSDYHKAQSQSRGTELNIAKKQLDDAYLDAEVDYIPGKINDLSRYHISNKHHLA